MMDVLSRYARKHTRRVIGLMSGTSADGVDAALVQISGAGSTLQARVERFHTTPYAPALREALFRLFAPDAPVSEVCGMNFRLGRVFAEAALDLISRAGISRGEVDLVASHGQTVCHRGGEYTMQLGEPAVIAELTGLPVAANFRPRDIAAGGQGAPLTPYADWALLRHPERARAVQNIGGIANVTYLPAGAGPEEVIGFDLGPGNMLIDGVARAVSGGDIGCDRDGEMAARGTVDADLLDWLMGHEFISRPPPKSAGREEFGDAFLQEVVARARASGVWGDDLAATVTAFTVESIVDGYRRFLEPRGEIDEVIVGGGGRYNPTLCRMLAARLPGRLLTHEDLGLSSEAKEALAFAVLGNETMLGRPANLPSVTGARRAVALGEIVLP